MKYILFFLLLLNCVIARSQDSWSYFAELENSRSFMFQPIELSDGNILVYLQQRFGSNTESTIGSFLLISPTGELISDHEVVVEEDYFQYRKWQFSSDKDTIYLIGAVEAPNEINHILIKSYSLTFDLLDTQAIPNDTGNDDVRGVETIINSEGNFLIVTRYKDTEEVEPSVDYYYEIDNELNILKSYTLGIEHSAAGCSGLIESYDNESYISSSGELIVIDSMLSSHIELPSFLIISPTKFITTGRNSSIHYWKDSMYLVANGDFGSGSYLDLLELNSDLDIVNYKEFQSESPFLGTATTETSSGDLLDYVYEDKVYVAGKEFFNHNYTWLAQFNENLEMNFITYIGVDDGNFHFPSGVEATLDGGALISGGYFQNTAFLLKFDSEGNLLTSVDEKDLDLNIVKVYPNPSDGVFQIDISSAPGKSYDLRLIDASGNQVFSENDLQSDKYIYDFTNFNNGTYFYQLYRNGKMVISGGWVKI